MTLDDLDPLQFLTGIAVIGTLMAVTAMGVSGPSEPAAVQSIETRQVQQRRADCLSGERSSEPIRIRESDGRGRFVTRACVGGRNVRFVIDTGATSVVLTWKDAEAVGLEPRSLKFNARASTAGGTTRIAIVRLKEVAVGGIVVRDVRAAVAQPQDLRESLLGMSFLSELSSFEFRPGELVLKP